MCKKVRAFLNLYNFGTSKKQKQDNKHQDNNKKRKEQNYEKDFIDSSSRNDDYT